MIGDGRALVALTLVGLTAASLLRSGSRGVARTGRSRSILDSAEWIRRKEDRALVLEEPTGVIWVIREKPSGGFIVSLGVTRTEAIDEAVKSHDKWARQHTFPTEVEAREAVEARRPSGGSRGIARSGVRPAPAIVFQGRPGTRLRALEEEALEAGMIVRTYSPGGPTRYRFINLEDEARRAAQRGQRWDPNASRYFSQDGQHTAFGLAKARAFVRSLTISGSRGIARSGRGVATAASNTPTADRLAGLEGVDVLGWLGEEGLSIWNNQNPR